MRRNYFNILLFWLVFLTTNCLSSQQKFLTRAGTISFDSKLDTFVPVKAKNNSVSAILNLKNGDIAVLAFVKSFIFKNSLMQEHFNESYAESDQFPKATFTGNINNFKQNNSGTYFFDGTLYFHGVQKYLTQVPLEIDFKDNLVQISGEILLNVIDFDIKVPKIVSRKIPKEIYVSIDLSLEKDSK